MRPAPMTEHMRRLRRHPHNLTCVVCRINASHRPRETPIDARGAAQAGRAQTNEPCWLSIARALLGALALRRVLEDLGRRRERARLNRLDLRVALRADRVEAVARLHARVGLVVEGGLDADELEEEEVALVRADGDGARRGLRHLLDREHRRARRRVEEAAIVDLVGDDAREVLEELRRAAVEHGVVDVGEARAEDLHAGRLVHAAALGADDPVLERVLDADAVAAADGVRLADDLLRRHLLAVDRDAAAALEREADLLHLVGRVGRPAAHLGVDDGHRRLDALEILRLVRQAREVRVRRVLLLGADEGLDAKLVEVGRHLRPARELLEELRVAPRGKDRHLRGQHVRVTLEAHLVVPAARRTVRQHVDVVLLHGSHQPAARHVAADAGGVPVATVVFGLRLHNVEAPLRHVVLEVDDHGLHAARRHALLHVVDVRLIRLPEVSAEGEHVEALLDEALAHRLRVKAARHADADALALERRGAAQLLRHCDFQKSRFLATLAETWCLARISLCLVPPPRRQGESEGEAGTRELPHPHHTHTIHPRGQ